MSLRKPLALLVVAFAFLLSMAVPAVIAQQNQEGGGSGLQLSPTRSDITGQPGEQKTFSITLKNVTQNSLTARAVLNDFESDGTSGTPKILVDERARTPYTLEKMLQGYTDLNLAAGETKEVKLTLNIPNDTAPGAYFGALRFAAVPQGLSEEEQDRQVALTASVGHLVFLEVPGDINEQIQVQSLKAQKNGKGGSFLVNTPNQVALSVKNLGNGFSRPFGKVTVKGMIGGEIANYDINNSDPRGIVLPNSTRTFTDKLEGVKYPGRYTMTASVAYGNGGEVVTYKSNFIYMPWWAIITLIVLIAAIAGGTYYVYRKRFAGTPTKKK